MNYGSISPKCKHLLHGADYNPEQWRKTSEIWEEDMRLMKLANCNVMSVGIFSWTSLEPEEGRFDFGWLDKIMDNLADHNAFAVLATPTGAKPSWMAEKYPEIRRVNSSGVREPQGNRHNHCYTSPVYREKAQIINSKLAQRYKDHPALLMWHISNEYSGECHCELCQEAFRQWLKNKYNHDLDQLNEAWWAGFWNHTYTDWSQIESPSLAGEQSIHALNLDWKRFVSYQTIDFFKAEAEPIRSITPDIPVTTNFMGLYPGIDYWKFAKELDVASWDNYPAWHSEEVKDWVSASNTAFVHDLYRSFKGGKPFMMMESTPSLVNWQSVNKLKRPGMHLLSSLQAVAHGSDTVQYFQWRKSRGGCEKFHGAVVDHYGHENTRVFQDVTEVGTVLNKLDDIMGTSVKPETAVIYDWENRWAIEDIQALRKSELKYQQTCADHYREFWKKGVPVDVINMDCDFSSYKLLIAPMLYMIRPGVAERIKEFVEKGGTFVATYWTGVVDENDLCILGGVPGPLREVLGIWSEEIDSLYDSDVNDIRLEEDNLLGLRGEYSAHTFCDLIHAETAKVMAVYKNDFYAGRPALTVNNYGAGKAFYMASRNEEKFLTDFYGKLMKELSLKQVIEGELPCGVTAQLREDDKNSFVFIMNFSDKQKEINLGSRKYTDVITSAAIEDSIVMEPYGLSILKIKK